MGSENTDPTSNGKCQQHSAVVARLNEHDSAITRVVENGDKLWEAVNDIRTRLLNRPQWWVTLLLAILLSAFVGMLVYTAQHNQKAHPAEAITRAPR